MPPAIALFLTLFPPAPPETIDCGPDHGIDLAVVGASRTEGDLSTVLIASCGAGTGCVGEITLRLRNCGAKAARLTRLDSPNLTCALGADGSLDLPAGHARSFSCSTAHEGIATIAAFVEVDGQPLTLAPFRVDARTDPSDAERAKCRACRGDWGRRGKAQIASCHCLSKTADRVCHDASDCDGDCVVEDAAAKGLTSGSSAVGKCTHYTGGLFGCHWRVESGKAVRICRDKPSPRIVPLAPQPTK